MCCVCFCSLLPRLTLLLSFFGHSALCFPRAAGIALGAAVSGGGGAIPVSTRGAGVDAQKALSWNQHYSRCVAVCCSVLQCVAVNS